MKRSLQCSGHGKLVSDTGNNGLPSINSTVNYRGQSLIQETVGTNSGDYREFLPYENSLVTLFVRKVSSYERMPRIQVTSNGVFECVSWSFISSFFYSIIRQFERRLLAHVIPLH
mmetsp:Transcript_10941/g.26293  ORF Transcript_10941/g.26293 Transcript_10941/m.26293 type:complete len:115 (-) Transcript_10941:694-1038(-)